MKIFDRWFGILMIAVMFAGVINMFIFQTYRVEGHSMDPTLSNQELLFVSKFVHTFSEEPDYNDIVIIRFWCKDFYTQLHFRKSMMRRISTWDTLKEKN
ncbi:signal peptidase I [Bacillus thuringiensis]|uniref:signal peptidase I n=1 Tax=Bacillus thuringiensis TaxID=1428 RepID=UPI000BF80042|nr:signal peptidase I [Bacillus thuringiensis]PFB47809.1 signal peptidase I [Bacillus thuringiensis]